MTDKEKEVDDAINTMLDGRQKQVDDAINTMLDCFGGADGGVTFIRLKNFTAQLIKKVEDPDIPDYDASQRLLDIVIYMGRLIDTIKK